MPSERSAARSSIFGPSAAAIRASRGTGVGAASSPSKKSRIVASGVAYSRVASGCPMPMPSRKRSRKRAAGARATPPRLRRRLLPDVEDPGGERDRAAHLQERPHLRDRRAAADPERAVAERLELLRQRRGWSRSRARSRSCRAPWPTGSHHGRMKISASITDYTCRAAGRGSADELERCSEVRQRVRRRDQLPAERRERRRVEHARGQQRVRERLGERVDRDHPADQRRQHRVAAGRPRRTGPGTSSIRVDARRRRSRSAVLDARVARDVRRTCRRAGSARGGGSRCTAAGCDGARLLDAGDLGVARPPAAS